MGMFRRIVLLVVTAGLLCGLYQVAPESVREHVEPHVAKAAEYMEPHVKQAKLELNSWHERMEPHMAKAKVEFNTLREHVGPLLDKHFAEAKVKAAEAKVKAVEQLAAAKVKAAELSSRARVKLQDMHASAVPMYKKYSAIAGVKAQAISESAAQQFDEVSASAQVLYASGCNASRTLSARAVQEFTKLKVWSQSDAPAVMMKDVQRKAMAAIQTVRQQVRTLVKQAPRDMNALKKLLKTVTFAQFRYCWAVGGSALLGIYCLVRLSLFIVGLCLALLRAIFCCRRQASTPLEQAPVTMRLEQAPQFSSGIFVDPEPSVRQSMNVTRRRRSDSPGAVAPRGATFDENRNPFAEQSLLASINNASPEELSTTIKGIGPNTAKLIIEYRSKHGDLNKISDLVEKVGMNHVVFSNFTRAQRL